MPNEIATTSGYIARETGMGVHEGAFLLKMVKTQYASEYGTKAGGARTGDSIDVKFPAEFVTQSSKTITPGSIQGIKEEVKSMPLDIDVVLPLEINYIEASLELEQGGEEYSKRVLQPAGQQMVNDIELPGYVKMAEGAQNTIVIEDPYADKEVTRDAFADMRARLDMNLVPKKGICTTILGSTAERIVSSSVLSFFNSGKQIEKAYEKGEMGLFSNLRWASSNNVHTRVNGAGGTAGVTVTSYTEGTDQITLSSTAGFVVGDKLEFTGTKMIHKRSKTSYGMDTQRAVLEVISATIIKIDPMYGPASGGQQNVSKLPIASDPIVVLGTAGESYMCCPVFHEDGITMASADLFLPTKGVEDSARNKVHNCSYTYVRAYDVESSDLISRMDALLMWFLLRPEWIGVVELRFS